MIVLISVVCLENYARTYVQVNNLSLVSSEDAFKITGIGSGPNYVNASCLYSSNGATWLLIFNAIKNFTNTNTGLASLYILKINQSTNFFVQSVDVVGEGLQFSYQSNFIGNGDFSIRQYAFVPEYLNLDNCSLAYAFYDAFSGYYNTTFDFTFKVYETTMLGILLVNETSIQFNEEITVP